MDFAIVVAAHAEAAYILRGHVSTNGAVIANGMLTSMSPPNSSVEDDEQKPELEWRFTHRERDEGHDHTDPYRNPAERGNIPWHRRVIPRPP